MAQDLWLGAVKKGLAASRPTTPEFPSSGFPMYYATDTGELSLYDSAAGAWKEVATPAAITSPTPGTNVTLTDDALAMRKIQLILDSVSIAVLEANGYGSAAIASLPDTNLLVLGVEADLTLVKDGTGYITTTDLDIALGTAAASNSTLSSTMVDVLAKQDVNTDALSVSLGVHDLAASPAFLGILDGAANAIYLNAAAATETGNDATLTASGTVTLFIADLGNETS